MIKKLLSCIWCQTLGLVLAGLLQTATAADLPLGQPHLSPFSANAYMKEMRSGGPSKDGIPSIDAPKLWTATQADTYLDAQDIVFGVYANGEARAYPQRVLVWHELVNDEIGGKALSISYCPLTATAIGFERGTTELGVSGNLINSNMVMYDRASDSYWPQILGIGISGPHRGDSLSEYPVVWTTWQNWKQRHPDTSVLSTSTGFIRNYRSDPYGGYNPPSGYYEIGYPLMFPVMKRAGREFAEKQMVLGFRTAELAVAVDLEHLRRQKVLHYEHKGSHFLIIHDPGLDAGWVFQSPEAVTIDPDEVAFTAEGPQSEDLESATPVNSFQALWFAWAAFYPDTVVLNAAKR
ncbi:MAG: DUF3179 domain-containing protein [Pseudomonadales bacterium]|nr:DUF3179 domain-containing protein [Pseudomonadales bacterium]